MKLRTLIILLSLLLVFSSALSVAAQDAVEPGQTIEGELEDSAEPIRYEIELVEDSFYLFDLQSDDFDTTVTIYDDNDSQLAYNDDGGADRNSLLLFVAPDDDTFVVEVGSFSGDGDYVLTITELEQIEIEIGSTVDAVVGEPQVFTFEADEGDIINVSVESEDDVETNLSLTLITDFYISEVRSVDFEFTGEDPAITNQALYSNGLYAVLVTAADEDAIGQTVALTVEGSEIGSLNDGPQEVELGSGESALFEIVGEEDQVFRITVTAAELEDFNSFNVGVAPEGGFSSTSISASSTQEISFLYIVPDDGETSILTLTSYTSEDITYTVTVEVVE